MTENPNKLYPALIRARAAIQPIPKTATNPHFKNSYAPLGEVLAAVLPALHAEGLALTAQVVDTSLMVRIVEQETGEHVASYVPLVGASDMQKLGGAMTYAMRYGVGMLLALELDDDDDGTKASVKSGGGQATASGGAPRPVQGAQGSARPDPRPQPAPARSQGKGGGHKNVAQEDDAEATLYLAQQLDADAEAKGPVGGKSPFQIIGADGKLGLYGKIAERAGVEPGKYSLAQLASRGSLPALRGFYAYLCTQNGLAGWTGGPQHRFPDQREAAAVIAPDSEPGPFSDEDLPF